MNLHAPEETTIVSMTLNPDGASPFISAAKASVDPTMLLREFTQNGIDAGATRIVWGYAICNGVKKLCVVDNGEGFDPDKMEELINSCFNSGREHGIGKNHGLGSKITGLRFSPVGVEYLSRRAGETSFRRVKLVEHAGQAGLETDEHGAAMTYVNPFSLDIPVLGRSAWDTPDGRFDSGTIVIFHGTTADHDTWDKQENVPGGRAWVSKFLNDRYFALPDDVVVKVTHPTTRDGKASTNTDVIKGLEKTLQSHTPRPESGTFKVSVPGLVRDGASEKITVHWFLDHEVTQRNSTNGRESHGGVFSVLYEGECYDQPDTAQKSRTRMSYAGLNTVYGRTTLLVEFGPNWAPNLTRSRVTYHGGDKGPDWSLIGQAIAGNLPERLAEAEKQASRRRADESSQDYRRQLNAQAADILQLLGMSNVSGTDGISFEPVRTSAPTKTAVVRIASADARRSGPRAAPKAPYIDAPEVVLSDGADMSDGGNLCEWVPNASAGIVYVREDAPEWEAFVAKARSLTRPGVAAEDTAKQAALHATKYELALFVTLVVGKVRKANPRASVEEINNDLSDVLTPTNLWARFAAITLDTKGLKERLDALRVLNKVA